MKDVRIIWDLDDDPDGNVQHVLEHDVTVEEVEDVLLNRGSETIVSRTSGNPATFGWTSAGRYIVVIFEVVENDPRTVRPITAYPTPPRRKRHGQGRRR